MQISSLEQVDFVPDWYRQDLKRRAIVRRQYIALAVLFLAMVIWNAFSMRSISIASAELAANQASARVSQGTIAQFELLVRQIAECRQQLGRMHSLVASGDPAAILAELSAIIGKGITAQRLRLEATRDGYELTIDGLAVDAQSLAWMLNGMQGSPYLSDVRLVYSRQSDQAEYGICFQVCCKTARYELPIKGASDD